VRIAPRETGAGDSSFQKYVDIKNVAAVEDSRRPGDLVRPDALALVRFGLRAADDPRIRDTARVVDALLKVETPSGPAWHRYNDDGYGEHEDGSPFDGTGIGRVWPLLVGERAHYELAAGRVEDLFSGGVERDAAQDAELRDRLYQEIGQMKVELDWLKKKHELFA